MDHKDTIGAASAWVACVLPDTFLTHDAEHIFFSFWPAQQDSNVRPTP